METKIRFSLDEPLSGGLELEITPAAAAKIEADPEYVLHAHVPATPEQLADPDNAPFISTSRFDGEPLISVHAPGVSPKG